MMAFFIILKYYFLKILKIVLIINWKIDRINYTEYCILVSFLKGDEDLKRLRLLLIVFTLVLSSVAFSGNFVNAKERSGQKLSQAHPQKAGFNPEKLKVLIKPLRRLLRMALHRVQ